MAQTVKRGLIDIHLPDDLLKQFSTLISKHRFEEAFECISLAEQVYGDEYKPFFKGAYDICISMSPQLIKTRGYLLRCLAHAIHRAFFPRTPRPDPLECPTDPYNDTCEPEERVTPSVKSYLKAHFPDLHEELWPAKYFLPPVAD